MVQFTGQTDTLSDGSGTWDYHNNTNCLWRIMPEGASSVTLYFSEFNTEEGLDVLQIFDLGSTQLLAEYSGFYGPEVPEPVTSPSGMMFLSFSTNSTVTAPGWTAWYESNLVGVEEFSDYGQSKLYPNPTNGEIFVTFLEDKGPLMDLFITDLFGKTKFIVDPVNLEGNPVTEAEIFDLLPLGSMSGTIRDLLRTAEVDGFVTVTATLPVKGFELYTNSRGVSAITAPQRY